MRIYVRLGLLVAAVLALGVLAGRGTPAHAWTYPAALNTNAATDSGGDENAQLTTDGAGNWVAVWHSYDDLGDNIGTDADILVSRSTDNGASWSALAALNTNAASDSGVDYAPEVTTDGGGNWLAVWYSRENLGGIGTDADILVARSTDNGASWSAPAALNSNAGSDSGWDWDPQVTTDDGGNWVAIWTSTENLFDENLGGTIGEDIDILVSRSTDNGATWTAPAALNTNAATDLWDDREPQVTTDGGGHWVAAWHSHEDLGGIGTDSDILVSRSSDNGATWTAPAALNTNAATDWGSDWLPQVTTDGAGNWLTVWYSSEPWVGSGIGTDYDILMSRSTDNGATWTDPAALNTNATTDYPTNDSLPQVTTDGGGNWLAVWQSMSLGMDRDILVSRSTDNGTTWIAPAALNTNAATDSGSDEYPEVTTDGAGNWLAVWDSTEPNVGSGIGTDYDILYSTEVWPLPPVGGIAELPDVSGSSGRNYVALAGLTAAVVALGAGGWYARRRWLG